MPSTLNTLLNINKNRIENCINLDALLSQNIITDDKILKSKSMYNIINKNKQIKWYKKNRALEKGYININTSYIIQLKNIVEHYIGEMNLCCKHCGAKHFNFEKVFNKGNSFNNCCNHGNVELDPLPQPPHVLYKLFTENHSKSKHFYDRIRA